ncbi:hypothetical protein BDZ94DRAFT_1165280 [Collybia nuda]|uniref:Transmembrane protein n=1 Tax=Collybia nuda TaxID=64659 RepID=A0A9P6CJD5_9AGAR|nr:hypothetical protein BDZ94DRAFT_1165280 [Collybia nuda]
MAKNFLDPAEIARDARVYGAFVLVLCGVAAWDVLSTIRFDISVVSGKRQWRWPMVLYFICRVCMLLHIFAIAVNLNAISEIPCQEVTWISKVSDAIETCGSSLILVLRTRAVWHRDLKVTVLLGILFLAQVALWIQTFRFSKAKWNPQRNVCAVISTAPKPILVSVFAYTMAFDLVILLLCAYRLSVSRRASTLGNILLRDGIAYFCAAFGANLVQTVMAALGLNPVMNIIALPFALVVSVIAATTVFRNVFTAFDGFSSESGGQNTGSGINSGGALNRMAVGGPRFSSSRRMTHDIPLSDYKSHDVTSVSVHRVVDMDVDGMQPAPLMVR